MKNVNEERYIHEGKLRVINVYWIIKLEKKNVHGCDKGIMSTVAELWMQHKTPCQMLIHLF